MINRIVLVARNRDDFTFGRRSRLPGFVLVNKNSEIVIIRTDASVHRSLVYGTIISGTAPSQTFDRVFSAFENFSGRLGTKKFSYNFNSITRRDRSHEFRSQ